MDAVRDGSPVLRTTAGGKADAHEGHLFLLGIREP
jgi:hypothetical protein